MSDWQTAANVIGAVGGTIGIIFGGLGIWYSRSANTRDSEAHDIFMTKFRREEEEKDIAARKNDLLRMATEKAYAMPSASALIQIEINLESELDKAAAWELSKEGNAKFNGSQCTITVSKV